MDKAAKVVNADEFFLKMEKQAKTGEIIVKVIVVLSYACLFAEFVPSILWKTFSVWSFIISILWSVCYYGLYLGRVWAKWLYIISSAAVIAFLALLLFSMIERIGMVGYYAWYPPMWILIATSAVRLVSCVLLIRSKSVHEFIYT